LGLEEVVKEGLVVMSTGVTVAMGIEGSVVVFESLGHDLGFKLLAEVMFLVAGTVKKLTGTTKAGGESTVHGGDTETEKVKKVVYLPYSEEMDGFVGF
jgi:hypothetical protein